MYSFEEMRKHFVDWSEEQILEEYQYVYNRAIETEDVDEFEEVMNAREFLAGYLAIKYFVMKTGRDIR